MDVSVSLVFEEVNPMGDEWSGEEYSAGSGHHRSFDDWFLKRLPPQPGDVVVDLGCGSGEFTALVADIVRPGRVIGVDPDRSMLATARRHTHPGLTYLEGSAEELEGLVDPDSIDKVISRAMLHWLPVENYPRVFEAVLIVLRPGGWFHSESGGAGNAPLMVSLLDHLAARFGLAKPPGFPDA
ncbi:MAG TPA: class I SAM-dependent methyltransferase, partial [Acidimicrobiia bacterium]|nr:class I SAM-dependent methyltransferase [Acidimicrobiia bacterium]